MISLLTKAQLQAATDAMTDDPADVVLADIWDRENACQFAGKPAMTPTQWLDFGKWYSEESGGLSADLAEHIEAFLKED
jgi:hypothetical protein